VRKKKSENSQVPVRVIGMSDGTCITTCFRHLTLLMPLPLHFRFMNMYYNIQSLALLSKPRQSVHFSFHRSKKRPHQNHTLFLQNFQLT
jgi:hypothetical protein